MPAESRDVRSCPWVRLSSYGEATVVEASKHGNISGDSCINKHRNESISNNDGGSRSNAHASFARNDVSIV